MKKFSCLLVILLAFAADVSSQQPRVITIHFFTSALCPACKRAAADIGRLSAPGKTLKIRQYEVSDKAGRIVAKNLRSMVAQLSAIDKQLGGRPFIVHERKKYRFHTERGIPYYMKKISATRVLKKEIPVPFFIIGDSAYIGYNRGLFQRRIRELSH